MTETTPTTGDVRRAYGDIHCPDMDDPAHAQGCPADAGFNRWLEGVKADAWRAGYFTGARDYAGSIMAGARMSTQNPYEEGASA